MSILSAIGGFFIKLGGFLGKAFGIAASNGLTDDLVKQALIWVRVAEQKYVDNTERREWVVGILKNKGVPESIARIAVELAFQVWRKEFDNAIPVPQ